MRILYGVHGYGRGHATRTLAVLPHLAAANQLLILAGGDAWQTISPDYQVVRIPTFGFAYGRQTGVRRRSNWQTFRHNLPAFLDLFAGGPTFQLVCDVVRLTGGEPFVREDFDEVARAVDDTSRPAVLHITSNGSFPEKIIEFAEQFPRPNKLRFMISFDGLAPEHDANRGADVTFSIAEETVQRLAALQDKLGLAVAANHTVISAQSLEDHFALADRLGKFGVDVQAVLAYSDSAMYGLKRFGKKSHDLIPNVGYPLHPNLAGSDAVGFVEQLIQRVSKLRDPLLRIGKNYYLCGLLARLRNETSPKPHPRCVALRSHLRILPDGSVPVCQFNTEKVGNLLDQNFDDVWYKSLKTQESRAWVDACHGCWAECEVMPSALYTGDLLLHSLTAPRAAKPVSPLSRVPETSSVP